MKASHRRRRIQREQKIFRAEEIIAPEILSDRTVDRAHLNRVLRTAQQYLPPPKSAPSPSAEAAAHRRPESLWMRRGKLAGLTLAAMVLLSSVVVATFIAQRPDRQALRGPEITGAAALGGFGSQTSTGQTSQGAASPQPAHPSPSGEATEPVPVTQQSADVPDSAGKPHGNEAANSQRGRESSGNPRSSQHSPTSSEKSPTSTLASASNGEKISAARDFYARMDKNPQNALSLLDPLLAGTGAQGLLSSWSTMKSVDVADIRVQPDGMVRSVVVMTQRDGSKVRTTQLLKLTKSKEVKIAQAWLLSAERM